MFWQKVILWTTLQPEASFGRHLFRRPVYNLKHLLAGIYFFEQTTTWNIFWQTLILLSCLQYDTCVGRHSIWCTDCSTIGRTFDVKQVFRNDVKKSKRPINSINTKAFTCGKNSLYHRECYSDKLLFSNSYEIVHIMGLDEWNALWLNKCKIELKKRTFNYT